MSNSHETIADIRKETEARFRELVEAWMQRRSTFQTTLGAMQVFNNVFDRLEAAHKREIGDSAKLREALEALVDVIDKCDSGSPLWWHSGAKGVKPLKDARAALAATKQEGDNNG